MLKNTIYLLMNKQMIHHSTDYPQWYTIGNDVQYLSSPFNLFKVVLVVPKRIRTLPLLIYKKIRFPDMRYFGQPTAL
jgi:hypothetical protein